MTTLEQQIAHFRDYWKVPQEDIDKLIELVKVEQAKKLYKSVDLLMGAANRINMKLALQESIK